MTAHRPDPAPDDFVVSCGTTWPIVDPHPDDAFRGGEHRCNRPALHPPPHRCVCGEVEP